MRVSENGNRGKEESNGKGRLTGHVPFLGCLAACIERPLLLYTGERWSKLRWHE